MLFFKNKKLTQSDILNTFGENHKNLYLNPLIIANSYDDDEYKIKNIKTPLWNYIPKINHMYSIFYSDFTLDPELEIVDFINMNTSYLKTLFFNKISFYDDLQYLPSLPFENFENTDQNDIVSSYNHLRRVSFIDFFINFSIDIPICFKKSPSLKSTNFQTPLLKFSNYLMRSGKREIAFKTLFLSIRLLLLNIKNKNLFNFDNWKTFYFFLSNYFNLNYNEHKFLHEFDYLIPSSINENVSVSFTELPLSFNYTIRNFLIFILSKISPLFSYFIYSVDKSIRKFSRGKSGKYTFVWKYVPQFKRLFLVMRWVIKDIKFSQNKKFHERIINIFSTLLYSPEKSFAWRSKTFSHNYVFKNFKKSLMSTLKTTH